jgi:hypothetical protein
MRKPSGKSSAKSKTIAPANSSAAALKEARKAARPDSFARATATPDLCVE